MKKFTQLFLNFTKICLLLMGIFVSGNALFAQKVALIGLDHSSNVSAGGTPFTEMDGFSFVATQNITAGNVIYITNAYYSSANTRFRVSSNTAQDDPQKFLAKYTAPAGGITKGTVVKFLETGTTTNVLGITCSSGSCGTVSLVALGANPLNFQIPAGQPMSIFAYEKGNDDPYSGTVTTVHSVLYDGYLENATTVIGGTIPAAMNPLTNFSTAIVLDGFPTSLPNAGFYTTIDFKTSLRTGAVSKISLEDPSNYDVYPPELPERLLSTTAFSNLNLVNVNPTVSVAVSPTSVLENSGSLVYTFTLSAVAASNITVNYSTTGSTATSGSDYTALSGSVVITTGNNSATVSVNPTDDATLEPNETLVLTVSTGTGYDVGSPSVATGTVTNDDTDTGQPKVAISGLNHGALPADVESFSFAALEDIAAGTRIYFTDNAYDKLLLKFTNESKTVFEWTAPATVNRGDVYVISENTNGGTAFTLTCSDGSGCGAVAVTQGSGMTFAPNGTTLIAFSDSNTDPFMGTTPITGLIHSVLYTGTPSVPGGTLSAANNPSSIYPNAVIIENFPAVAPVRTEYKFASGERAVSINRSLFTTQSPPPPSWLHAASTLTVSTVRFTNIIIATGVALPQVLLNVSPSSVVENTSNTMTYTFTLSQNATADLTVNFSFNNIATLTTDYTVVGSPSSGFTYSGGVGTIRILMGTNSATITLTPVGETLLEANEAIIVTTTAGTGYDVGSPSVATGTIVNDDFLYHNPLVAIIGINAGNITNQNPDGFSFVANQNLAAGQEVFLTSNAFSNTSLSFATTGFFVLKFTVGAGGLAKGQVVYAVETGATTNAFTVTCSAGSNCGTITFISGDFTFASGGAKLSAYSDADNDPTNGVLLVHSTFITFTGTIPTAEDPRTVYPNAVVVDGFNNASPDRTEHKFASNERSSPVNLTSIQSATNYLVGQTTQVLSVVPFAALNLCPATINTQPTAANISVNINTQFSIMATGVNLSYQWQVDIGAGFVNINNGGIYSGANTNTLLLTGVACTFTGNTYRCIVNACAISTSALLTVTTNFSPTTTNNALNFDGTNDYVIADNCTAQSIVSGGSAITVEYWFKGSVLQSAVRSQDGGGYMVAGWNNKHILSNDGATAGGVAVGAAATDGSWHHVAFTWQQGAMNGFKSYLDGILVEQKNAANVPLPTINNPLYLGAFQGNSEFTNGSLDNVRVWNIVRNQAEIQTGICNLSLPQTGLLVYYTFDHGQANLVNAGISRLENKASNINFTGTLTNFALTGASSNWVTGVIPNTLSSSPVSLVQNVTTSPIFTNPNCTTMGKVEPTGASQVAGNVTFKSWLEPINLLIFVQRHYEINPTSSPGTATGNITLYFTQADFDEYNTRNTIKLPQNPTDAAGISNIRIVKFAGTSAPNNDGLPSSYAGAQSEISNIISAIWNGQFWEIKFFTTGFSGFFITGASAPLPLNLILFTGKNTENGNLLNWKTANEKGFSHFEIQRSANANSFEKIGEVKGINLENYQFIDNQAKEVNYYRLKMIDLDGKYNYSKTILIENSIEKSTVGLFYPNPSQGKSYIEITTLEKGKWEIKTFDITGKLLNSETKFLQKGINNISIEKLSNGINFVKFENGFLSEIRKLIMD